MLRLGVAGAVPGSAALPDVQGDVVAVGGDQGGAGCGFVPAQVLIRHPAI